MPSGLRALYGGAEGPIGDRNLARDHVAVMGEVTDERIDLAQREGRRRRVGGLSVPGSVAQAPYSAAAPLTRQVNPLIRDLTHYRDVIARKIPITDGTLSTPVQRAQPRGHCGSVTMPIRCPVGVDLARYLVLAGRRPLLLATLAGVQAVPRLPDFSNFLRAAGERSPPARSMASTSSSNPRPSYRYPAFPLPNKTPPSANSPKNKQRHWPRPHPPPSASCALKCRAVCLRGTRKPSIQVSIPIRRRTQSVRESTSDIATRTAHDLAL